MVGKYYYCENPYLLELLHTQTLLVSVLLCEQCHVQCAEYQCCPTLLINIWICALPARGKWNLSARKLCTLPHCWALKLNGASACKSCTLSNCWALKLNGASACNL